MTKVSSAAVSKENFERLRDEFVRQMTPWVKGVFPNFNRDLHIYIDWDVDLPYAVGGIRISGGVARLPYMTEDALAFILCHEIGHSRDMTNHYVGRGISYGGDEIRADYFAATQCLPHLLQNASSLRDATIDRETLSRLPVALQQACATQTRYPQDVCLRTQQAVKVTMDFIYLEFFVPRYQKDNLPPPSLDRAWLNDADFVQCREMSASGAVFSQAPLMCKDI